MPAYRWHRQEFPNSNAVCQTGVMTWIMKKAAGELKRARNRTVIRSQPVACKSEKTDGEIASV